MSLAPETTSTNAADSKVATQKIFTGTATATAVGFMSGGAYGFIARGMNPIVTAASMGLNFGIVSLGFFSIRELIVSPLLVKNLDWEEYVRRRHAFATDEPSSSSRPVPTLSKMRTEGLLDTALAGACVGVVLNSARRGARGIIPGAITVSSAFSGLQYVANSLHIARLQYLTAQKREAVAVMPPSLMDHKQPPSHVPGDSSPPQPPTSSSSSLFDTLKSFFPVKRLTPEEFAALKERGRKEKEEEKAESSERPN